MLSMVERRAARMESSGDGPAVTIMDESPASSRSSSPGPDSSAPHPGSGTPRPAASQSRDAVPTSQSSSSSSSMQAGAGAGAGGGGGGGFPGRGRPAAANAARERSRVQTLRHAFLELQRTLPAVPPDTKLSKLDVLILATTYIAHLTRTLQEEGGADEAESARQAEALHSLKGDGYLHPVKKWPMRSRLYVGASGQFLHNSNHAESENQGPSSSSSSSKSKSKS